MKTILWILFLSLQSTPLFADTNQSPDADRTSGELVQTVLPVDTAKVGEPIVMTLIFNHSIDTDVVLPEKFPSARWQLVDHESSSQPHERGQKSTLILTFAVFRPGPATLPSFVITLLDRDGQTTELATSQFSIKVLDGLGDTIEPGYKPPRKPIEIWVEDFTIAWVAGIGSGALLFGLLGFIFWNRREVIIIEPPPRSPHQIALEKLAGLAADDLLERGEFMLFYVRVSEAIREYLGNVHDFPGTELTTTEIMAEIESKFFPPGISAFDVAEFLRETDLVKFAGARSSIQEGERILRRAFTIVELTRMPTVGLKTTDSSESEAVLHNEALHPESPWAPEEQE